MAADVIRDMMAQAQWEITKGHLRASVALMSGRRAAEPVYAHTDLAEKTRNWIAFRDATEAYIAEVENHGWAE